MRTVRQEYMKRSARLRWRFIFVLLVGICVSFFLYEPSPRLLDTARLSKTLSPPSFSAHAGFYDSPFMLSLFAEPGSKIYYTLNSSTPGNGSILYKEPLLIIDRSSMENTISNIPTSPRYKRPWTRVPKGTVIRSTAVADSRTKSKTVTHTYFVGLKYSLPVISLVADSHHLFGYKEGIYIMGKAFDDKDNYARKDVPLDSPWWDYPANYRSRGDNSERPVNLQFFGFSQEAFSADAGVRISGNATRGFSQKSLRIVFRKQYGTPLLDHPLIEGTGVTAYNSFVLRNSGNDWDKTMMRDVFMQSLLRQETSLNLQASRPVILFINGEYWGIHHLTERLDEDYLASHYKIDPRRTAIIENNGTVFHGTENDAESYLSVIRFVTSNDLSDPVKYEEVKQLIDIDNLLDYLIAEIYFVNTDWPSNNVRAWKYTGGLVADSIHPLDGRWRWMVSDLDWGFGYTSSDSWTIDMFSRLREHPGAVGQLYRGLSTSPEFREKLNSRFSFHLQNTFEPARVIRTLDDMAELLRPEMSTHIARWRVPRSIENWEENLEVMRNFARQRPQIVKEQLKQAFSNLQ
jgi:hypothetical protein